MEDGIDTGLTGAASGNAVDETSAQDENQQKVPPGVPSLTIEELKGELQNLSTSPQFAASLAAALRMQMAEFLVENLKRGVRDELKSWTAHAVMHDGQKSSETADALRSAGDAGGLCEDGSKELQATPNMGSLANGGFARQESPEPPPGSQTPLCINGNGVDESEGFGSTKANAAMAFAIRQGPIDDEYNDTPYGLLPLSKSETFSTKNSDPKRKTLHEIAFTIVHSVAFEYLVTIAILLNAFYIGAMTHYMAAEVAKDSTLPLAYIAFELLFLVVFSLEIILRVYVYRLNYFRWRLPDGRSTKPNPQFLWNVFDCTIVGLKLVEMLTRVLVGDEADIHGSISVLRVLRVFRALRILRVVKVLKYFQELQMIVISTLKTINLFVWSMVAVMFMTFIASVHFTETVRDFRVSRDSQNELDPVMRRELDKNFGDLLTTTITLVMTVTGGVDWVVTYDLLGEVGDWYFTQLPLLGYVMFLSFALMNVITGVFLEQALDRARDERELYLMQNARCVFAAADRNGNGMINWEDFQKSIEDRHMHAFFEAIEIDLSQARNLFDLLDMSGDGQISSEEFLNGCMRVRGPAKALDLLVLSREVAALFQSNTSNHDAIKENREALQYIHAEIEEKKVDTRAPNHSKSQTSLSDEEKNLSGFESDIRKAMHHAKSAKVKATESQASPNVGSKSFNYQSSQRNAPPSTRSKSVGALSHLGGEMRAVLTGGSGRDVSLPGATSDD